MRTEQPRRDPGRANVSGPAFETICPTGQLPMVATPASDITIERLLTVGSQIAHWW